MANPIGHFEFMVNDPARAKEFYGKIFNWEFEDSPPPHHYAMIHTGTPPDGGIMKKPDQAPCPSLNVYFVVDGIDRTLEKVKSAGGNVLVGRTEIEVGAWAMFVDPDGIPVGIFEPKK